MTLSKPARSLALLLIAAACLSFIGLGKLPLLEPDEGRNAEVAREMVVTHDWITPHYDSLPYLDKPVVFFWMIAAAFRAFGISPWAARFPEAIAALAAVLLIWLMGRSMFCARAGLMAGLILATSPLFFGFARTVIFDMPLAALVTASLFCFWLNRRKHILWLDALAFAAMGVAAITKGPVGFLLPLFTLVAYYALAGRFRELKQIHWAVGWIIFLAAALPWFIAVSLRNPDFPKYAFWEESLLRFTTGAGMHRSNGPLYYIPVYFAGFFPWSFFLLFAAWGRIKSWRRLRDEAHEAELFLLAWAGVIFVFFTLSRSKLPGYVLPALPALALLAGKAWEDARSSPAPRSAGWMSASFGVMVAAGVALGIGAEWLRVLRSSSRVLARIPPSVAHLLPGALLHGAVILAALGVLGWRWNRRAHNRIAEWSAFAAAALTVPLLALIWFPGLSAYAQADSSQELAQTILRSPQRDLPIYGYYYFRTGLPFYLQRPVGLITEDGDESTSNYITHRFAGLRNSPGARICPSCASPPLISRGALIDGSEFNKLTGRSPFLLMARNGQVAQLMSAGNGEPLWTGWRFSVLLVAARPGAHAP